VKDLLEGSVKITYTDLGMESLEVADHDRGTASLLKDLDSFREELP